MFYKKKTQFRYVFVEFWYWSLRNFFRQSILSLTFWNVKNIEELGPGLLKSIDIYHDIERYMIIVYLCCIIYCEFVQSQLRCILFLYLHAISLQWHIVTISIMYTYTCKESRYVVAFLQCVYPQNTFIHVHYDKFICTYKVLINPLQT